MARIQVPAADEVIDQSMPVLDQGFVRLVDYMGGDARVVQSARVSYGEGTKTVREDQGLINYLMKNAHTSPFEQVELTFHVKAPIFVIRQWFRHRTASVNEISGRYSVLKDEFYRPEADAVRAQSLINKQVGEGVLSPEVSTQAIEKLAQIQSETYAAYLALLDDGVARELARTVLPVGLYSEFYWKQNLHNLFHFLRLRMDWHAQAEIRAYALVMADMAQRVAPMCFQAFQEHVVKGVRFGGGETEALGRLLAGKPHGLEGKAAQEFEAKLTSMSRERADGAPTS